jgi:hypothetical protein
LFLDRGLRCNSLAWAVFLRAFFCFSLSAYDAAAK